MHQRLHQLESTIRDALWRKLVVDHGQSSAESTSHAVVILTFEKHETELIELFLYCPSKIDLFDDDLCSNYVSHIKALWTKQGIELSFDPHDERIDMIEDRDNEVFICNSYEIRSSPIKDKPHENTRSSNS